MRYSFLMLLLAVLFQPTASRAVTYDVYAVCRLNPQGDNFLALRSGPSSSSAMLAKLGPGTEVYEDWEIGRRGKWMPVFVEGWQLKGWVFTDYVCQISDH